MRTQTGVMINLSSLLFFPAGPVLGCKARNEAGRAGGGTREASPPTVEFAGRNAVFRAVRKMGLRGWMGFCLLTLFLRGLGHGFVPPELSWSCGGRGAGLAPQYPREPR